MSEATVLLPAIAALAVTIAGMTALRPIAFIVDLVDRPGGHKTHNGIVPVVGGLAMLLGVTVGLASTSDAFASLQYFLLSATVLVVVGLFDDRFTLSPAMRLMAQFAAVIPMVYGAGVYMHDFGDLLGTGPLVLDSGRLFVTAFVTMAAINAFNMVDGLDGLAGGLTLVAVVTFLAMGAGTIGAPEHALAAVLAAAVAGFLVFNVPVQGNRKIRCFMGDAGSTLLGFAVAWLAISVSQHAGSRVSAITTVWFVAVPATDLLWTVIRRVMRRQSPFHPDNEHLHHMLRNAGFGVRAVFCTMVVTAILCAAAGVALHEAGAPDRVSLALLCATAVLIVLVYRKASVLLPFLPEALVRLPGDERSRAQVRSGD